MQSSPASHLGPFFVNAADNCFCSFCIFIRRLKTFNFPLISVLCQSVRV
jgi:hypothetical protein